MSKYYSIPPQLYDNQFWWKKNDIEFWKTLFKTQKKILEFASGTGRLAIPLIRDGFTYSGVEISKEYIDYAYNKHNLQSIIHADMRCVDLNETFDYLFIGFNSFSHLLNSTDASLFLDTVKRHMHNKSYFYIDLFMPHSSFLYDRQDKKSKIMDFFDSEINQDVIIEETLTYDNQSEIISVNWDYIKNKNSIYRTFKFQMKAYYPDTMNRLLIDSGFFIHSVWGDYERSTLTETSDIQIYKCSL